MMVRVFFMGRLAVEYEFKECGGGLEAGEECAGVFKRDVVAGGKAGFCFAHKSKEEGFCGDLLFCEEAVFFFVAAVTEKDVYGAVRCEFLECFFFHIVVRGGCWWVRWCFVIVGCGAGWRLG